MNGDDDLNSVNFTGTVIGAPMVVTAGNGIVTSFRLAVGKNIRVRGEPSRKESLFKVVLFDSVAERNDGKIHTGTRLVVHGELDRAETPGGQEREIRIVGRFVKII